MQHKVTDMRMNLNVSLSVLSLTITVTLNKSLNLFGTYLLFQKKVCVYMRRRSKMGDHSLFLQLTGGRKTGKA